MTRFPKQMIFSSISTAEVTNRSTRETTIENLEALDGFFSSSMKLLESTYSSEFNPCWM